MSSTLGSYPNPIPDSESHRHASTTIQATPLPFRADSLNGSAGDLPSHGGSEEIGVQFVLIVEMEQEIQIYPLNTVIYTIGRSVDNSIHIQDRFLSRHHAYLVRVPLGEGYTYSLFDGDREQSLPSRNGVFVNDQRIKSHSLRTGDVIYFGPNVRAILCSKATLTPEQKADSEKGVPAEAPR